MPLFKPVTVQFKSTALWQMAPPGVEATLYMVIGEPPLEAGVQETATEPLPATPDTLMGALGGPVGITVFEAAEGALFPAVAVVATTVKVYGTPFVKVVTRQEVDIAVADEHVFPSGLEVAIYPVIAGPFAVESPQFTVA